jgi:hypothetical protein
MRQQFNERFWQLARGCEIFGAIFFENWNTIQPITHITIGGLIVTGPSNYQY